MAKRIGAKTMEINASHLPLISQPDAVTNLIIEGARRLRLLSETPDDGRAQLGWKRQVA